jgi:hypothetical protein
MITLGVIANNGWQKEVEGQKYDPDGTRTRNLCHNPMTGKQRLTIRPPGRHAISGLELILHNTTSKKYWAKSFRSPANDGAKDGKAGW